MSEYQYYEFQAIDRPLSEADRQALRDLSTRARITATSFTNSYEWGDFKGDPAKLMERWFDLHLYLANWGSRRLMIRLPKRLIDRHLLDAFLGEVDCAELRVSGENLILDIGRDEVESEDWDDGSGWLAALAPLRAEVLAGDLRLFYLLWLTAVEADAFEADEPEPMPGIGPMTASLEAFAEFFGIDSDLVEAAAERSAAALPSAISSGAVQGIISAMTDREKTGIARHGCSTATPMSPPNCAPRSETVWRAAPARRRSSPGPSANCARAPRRSVSLASRPRPRSAPPNVSGRRKRRRKPVRPGSRRSARRGESVRREVEAEIEQRNAPGYDKAASLLLDLQAVAEDRGAMPDFKKRLNAIRERHAAQGAVHRAAGEDRIEGRVWRRTQCARTGLDGKFPAGGQFLPAR